MNCFILTMDIESKVYYDLGRLIIDTDYVIKKKIFGSTYLIITNLDIKSFTKKIREITSASFIINTVGDYGSYNGWFSGELQNQISMFLKSEETRKKLEMLERREDEVSKLRERVLVLENSIKELKGVAVVEGVEGVGVKDG